MGRLAFTVAVVSGLFLLGGPTAGVVSGSGQVLSTATVDATVPQTVASDRAALVALYNATGGPNWWNNTNWLSNAPLGEWYGVGTDISGRVVGLELYGNGLSGTIPSELSRLANLRTLWIHNNQLSGEIPPGLGNLANLPSLLLYSNQLSGEIPSEFGNLANLESLLLQNNQLNGEIPPELGGLANLRSLWLANNELSGEIPPELGGLANLRSLWLANNELSGEIPPELRELANLQLLRLSSNQLSGEIPPELRELANLQLLWLVGNQFSGEIPPELGNLANLQLLNLFSNQLSGEIPPELGNLANLERLYLSNNRLEGCIPRGLEGVENNDIGRLGLPFCLVPGPPTITALIIAGDNSLTMAWAAPTSGPAVTAYDLRYIRTDADETVESNWNVVEDVWTGAGALRYVLNGLAAGTQYNVQVRAVSPGGNGPWSATVSGTPLGRIEDGDSLGNKVTGVKVEATPNYPNTIAKWTVQFVNGDISSYWYDGTDNKDQDDNTLYGGTDKGFIMIEFEDDVQFPETFSPNDVVITTNMVWDGQAVDRTVVPTHWA